MIAVRQTRLCLGSRLLKGPTLAALGSLSVQSNGGGSSASLEGDTVTNDAKKKTVFFSRKLNV